MSKVVEKAALKQFIKHCNESSLLPYYQSAYRKNYSCETALVKLFDDILWSMEKQKVNLLVAIDLSAAFNTVDHDILIKVLKMTFNVHGKSLDWFKLYLYPRSCKVNIGESFSNSQDLNFSVPQGSLCGPVLYNAYASTMKSIVPLDIDIHTYADDHALKKEFNSSVLLEEVKAADKLSRCLDDVRSWMNSCHLKMNTDKTEAIRFGSKQQIRKCSLDTIEVCGEFIPYSQSIKYLGVCIDGNLSLDNHIAAKCRIAMFNLFKIANIRTFLMTEACHTAVLAMVISHLDYANAIMVGLPEKHIRKLQIVQNMVAKVVLKRNKYTSSKASLQSLHWLPVRSRIDFKITVLVYKCLHGEAPEYLQNLLITFIPKREGLRSEAIIDRLIVPRTGKKTFADRAFSVVGPKVWNSLPNHIKTEGDVGQFKKSLKTHLFKKAFNI